VSIDNQYIISSTNQNDVRELIPEFFVAPEFLTNRDHFDLGRVSNKWVNDVVLPPWAATPFDFVYIMRKALESEIVSRAIHHWIDLVWGDKQRSEKANNIYMAEMYEGIWTEENLSNAATRAEIEAILCHVGQIPPQLFERPHPRRAPKAGPGKTVSRCVAIDLKVAKVIGGAVSIDANRKVRIATISHGGFGLVAQFSPSQVARLIPPFMPKWPELILGQENVIAAKLIRGLSEEGKPLAFANDSFLIAESGRLHRVFYESGLDEIMISSKSEIVCLAVDHGWLVCCDEDSVISIHELIDLSQAKWTIPTFSNLITCTALSIDFRGIVCGTKDGTVLFCSFSDRSVVNSVQVGENANPVSIMISQGWGFVVVYFTKIDKGKQTFHMGLYSINGQLIRERELKNEMTAWCGYRTVDGFDFMVVADVKGNLFWFEVFFMEVGEGVNIGNEVILAVAFNQDDQVAVAITAEGRLVLCPMK
jgi:hypothetical protein